LEIAGDSTKQNRDSCSQKQQTVRLNIDDLPPITDDNSRMKIGQEDDDLEKVLCKARRVKQQENIIKKEIDVSAIKANVKSELDEKQPMEAFRETENGFVTLNQTAELCRTLGDVPTYCMTGNWTLKRMKWI
jgi:U4/U6.U5 tri-snRNP-associated protein 1